jgi:hypothetical protein
VSELIMSQLGSWSCPCGGQVTAAEDELGRPAVIHSMPTCKDYDRIDSPVDFLAWLNSVKRTEKQLTVLPSLGTTYSVGWLRDDGLFHQFAQAVPGERFRPVNGNGGPHWPCSVCDAHGYTEADFDRQMKQLEFS